MALPSLNEVIRNYLYGSNTVPQNFVRPELIRLPEVTNTLDPISSLEFMAGPGRFALASSFDVVGDFFDDVNGYDVSQLFVGQSGNEVRLLKSAWAQGILGLNSSSLAIDHKDFDDGQDAYATRVYIWGNTPFQISEDAEFVVTRTHNADGSYMSHPVR